MQEKIKEDMISRQAAIDALGEQGLITAMVVVDRLPSAQPEHEKGEWIRHPKGIYAHLVCNKCLSNAPYDCETNFCPNCGADMREGEKSGINAKII